MTLLQRGVGSRARGEPARSEHSDVDLLVIAADASWDAKRFLAAIEEALG